MIRLTGVSAVLQDGTGHAHMQVQSHTSNPETLNPKACAPAQVTCSLEIPFFYVQGYLLGKFEADTVMDMVLFAYVLRLSCYALLPWWGSPWAVLPVETLHGFTFAAGVCVRGLGCAAC